jgi:dihydropteroate synthase
MVYCESMINLSEWMSHRNPVLVMGIVNVTPDSFYDGGRFVRPEDAIERGLRMADEGADIIDVGGESTRPGARPIAVREEIGRVLPVVEGLRARSPVHVSIDTTKAQVAEEAVSLGAAIINDVTALRSDERMSQVAARTGAFVVLMHMRGSPETMQQSPSYSDVVEQIGVFLNERIHAAVDAGIARGKILVDPGIGFGKTVEHNLAILRNLQRLTGLGPPILVGVSRKSFLGAILGLPSDERSEATIAANTAAILNGASIIRVHDAKEGRRTADIAVRLRSDVPASR